MSTMGKVPLKTVTSSYYHKTRSIWRLWIGLWEAFACNASSGPLDSSRWNFLGGFTPTELVTNAQGKSAIKTQIQATMRVKK